MKKAIIAIFLLCSASYGKVIQCRAGHIQVNLDTDTLMTTIKTSNHVERGYAHYFGNNSVAHYSIGARTIRVVNQTQVTIYWDEETNYPCH